MLYSIELEMTRLTIIIIVTVCKFLFVIIINIIYVNNYFFLSVMVIKGKFRLNISQYHN